VQDDVNQGEAASGPSTVCLPPHEQKLVRGLPDAASPSERAQETCPTFVVAAHAHADLEDPIDDDTVAQEPIRTANTEPALIETGSQPAISGTSTGADAPDTVQHAVPAVDVGSQEPDMHDMSAICAVLPSAQMEQEGYSYADNGSESPKGGQHPVLDIS
jgi:hypothetical protein